MHITILIFTVFACWRYGDWRNWQKYHSTLLYVVAANLLYTFIYHDNLLWELEPKLLIGSHVLAELLYTFIIFPSSVLILLNNYPESLKLQALRILKFIIIYVVLEYIAIISGYMFHHHGWSMWWSLAWNFIMFPLWVLHYKRPLTAYVVSFFFVLLVLYLFPVSIIV